MIRRHPVIALLGVNLALFATFALLAEGFLRLYVPYNPGYYVAVRGTSQEVEYPYGTIKINRDGFADVDWDLGRERHIGYFGDSVTYGVGAGYGYRFTDLLRAAYPRFTHLNLGGIGLSITRETTQRAVELADRYDLDTAVYFMNLNDIVPDSTLRPPDRAATNARPPWTRRALGFAIEYTDWLRGKSYLYTSLRTLAKNQLEAVGVGFHGFKAYEFYPTAEHDVLAETAHRIELFHDALAARGTELIVVLLPYEMQISEEAARVYQGHGIDWEPGFLEGSTQRALKELLSRHMRVIDLLPAFVDPNDRERARSVTAVGEYFVYDRGDKLDWNHPNRAGHGRIADYLIHVGLLDAQAAGSPREAIAHADSSR